MIYLLAEVRPTDRMTDYPSMVDLPEALALPDVQRQTRFWASNHKQVVRFGWLLYFVVFVVSSGHRSIHDLVVSTQVTKKPQKELS